MFFCEKCNNYAFIVFENKNLFCVSCGKIYTIEKDKSGSFLKDTGLIK